MNSEPTELAQPAPAIGPRDIKARMDAVERLTKLFMAERVVYLFGTTIALAMLLFCAISLIVSKKGGIGEALGLFGSGGLISYTGSRLLVMWSQALRLLAGEPTGGQP